MNSDKLIRRLTLLQVALVALLILLPIAWVVLSSFKPSAEVTAYPPELLFRPTLDNYRTLFGTTPFLHYTWNSTVVTIGSTAIGLLLGVKHYEAFCGTFKAGDHLTIRVRNLLASKEAGAGEDLALSAFDANILRGDQELARARLSVMEPPASLLAQIATPAWETAA